MLRRTNEYFTARGNDQAYANTLAVIIEHAQRLIPVLVDACGEGPCSIREASARVICEMTNVNDTELLHLVMNSNCELVDHLCGLLLVKNLPLASTILAALGKLCEFGDRIALQAVHPIMENPNPFLQAAIEADLQEVLEQVCEIYADSEDMQELIEALRNGVERSLRHQDIDFGEDSIEVVT
jgi:hypothetical protein